MLHRGARCGTSCPVEQLAANPVQPVHMDRQWLLSCACMQVTRLHDIYRAWSAPDSGVRAILLTGAGDKVCCHPTHIRSTLANIANARHSGLFSDVGPICGNMSGSASLQQLCLLFLYILCCGCHLHHRHVPLQAFCAGGDVKHVALQVMGNQYDAAMTFFKQEYITDATISTLSLPHISLLDGITMGGGAGVSMHGHFRVATERSAMS